MREQVLKIVTRETDKFVAPETKIESLGIDSLEFIDLINALELECSVALSEDSFDQFTTVGDLIRAVEAAKAHDSIPN